MPPYFLYDVQNRGVVRQPTDGSLLPAGRRRMFPVFRPSTDGSRLPAQRPNQLAPHSSRRPRGSLPYSVVLHTNATGRRRQVSGGRSSVLPASGK